jgi:glycosyltransferase involved in cell wall biosynthesis
MKTCVEVSAYVPCHNQRSTVGRAVAALSQQTARVSEVFVVDDGSTDGLASEVEGARVIRLGTNRGRGAARARAMEEARYELVACCDATNTLAADFVSRALPWFEDAAVAGVYGRIWSRRQDTVAARWRSRHLFKDGVEAPPRRHALLATYGCLLRRSAVMAVGNFNPAHRHSEDAELGLRLLAAGYDVVSDPSLRVESLSTDSLFAVLNRYWRWNAGAQEQVSWRSYLKTIRYAAGGMARDDLRAGDVSAMMVSLFCPHYQFWRSWFRRRAGRVQR